MRIVYFLPDLDAGVSRIVKNLIQYKQSPPGIEYTVVLVRRNDLKENATNDDFQANEIIHFTYKAEENAFNVFRRLSLTLKSDHDVIVGNDGLEIKMVAAMQLKNPVVYIMHGDFSSYYSLIRTYHSVLDCIITYSNKIEQEIRSMNGLNIHSVHKIYYPSASANNIYKLKRKEDKFRIVFAGLIIERKGADLLPAIYDQLVQSGMRDFELLIIGEGELLPHLKRKFETIPNVRFSGWRNQDYVITQMQTADVFLFPSRLEGLPNVIIEALATGAVPVVTNLESGISDLIQNGFNGLLIEKDDITGFSQAILKLYNNQKYLQYLRDNGTKCLDMFEPYQQARKYEDLIIKTGRERNGTERIFPSYKPGRVLDRSWLPGWVVYFLRRIFPNPKL